MPTLNRQLNVIVRCAALYREKALAGTGVGPYENAYLIHICRNPGTSQETLAKKLYVNKSSVTRHLSHLESEGFLRREPDENDRRSLLVYPTEKALALLPRLREISKEWESLLTAGMTAEESETFLNVLGKAFEAAKAAVREDTPAGKDCAGNEKEGTENGSEVRK